MLGIVVYPSHVPVLNPIKLTRKEHGCFAIEVHAGGSCNNLGDLQISRQILGQEHQCLLKRCVSGAFAPTGLVTRAEIWGAGKFLLDY
jgi:hypothetical protein